MIGDKIKELRISRNWTTRGFAEKLGVAHAMIRRYENGETIPRPGMMQRIATLFEVTLSELTNTKPMKLTGIAFDPKRYEQLLADSRQLDEDSKTLVSFLIAELLEKKRLKDYKSKIEQLK